MAKGFKTGGREPGTPNKLTKELRDALKSVLQNEIELLPEHLEQLEPKDRLELLSKFLPFVLPKLETFKGEVNHSGTEIRQITIAMPEEEKDD
jgi:hypothetical protein